MRDWMKAGGIHPSEITDERLFRSRRRLLQVALAAGTGGVLASLAAAELDSATDLKGPILPSDYSTDEELTSFDAVTSYNNFYELGTDKSDPARYADRLRTDPWSVTIDGECGKPGTYTLEDILRPHAVEERVYRLRCVEAWSMVVPWNGFALKDLLNRFEPQNNARYVAFETVGDQKLPGMSRPVLEWPYREGLRIDEAMHPLSMVAIGVYGKVLPNQNGAPLRLVVPWKYGFKSIKSIVRISFTERQPPTSWNMAAPREYGFYSNVNPAVSHPRWSQARERRLAGDIAGFSALFAPKIETRFMNGYADEVAGLYTGMDLKQNY